MNGKYFDFPKPTRLISRMLKLATQASEQDIVLDFFAGSGTTAHAVLDLNQQDGGNRRFILVEMDNNIARSVKAERVKRVSTGYANAKGQVIEGLGGGFDSINGTSFYLEGGSLPLEVWAKNEEGIVGAVSRHGKGKVIVLGMDYYDPSEETGRVLVNAVQAK